MRNVNVNMLNVLQLAQECQQLLGTMETTCDYSEIYNEILYNFNKPVSEGGFWDQNQGFYIHGNNGRVWNNTAISISKRQSIIVPFFGISLQRNIPNVSGNI